jgi:hypothetical protein
MKSCRLCSALTLCLVFVSVQVRGQEVPRDLHRFLEMLRSEQTAPLPAQVPRRIEKSACWASATCANGSTISCTGTGTCTGVDGSCRTGVSGYVQCGTSRTSCPSPSCYFCRSPCQSGSLGCSSSSEETCEIGECWYACDGWYYQCEGFLGPDCEVDPGSG